jgi:hypothetical protein
LRKSAGAGDTVIGLSNVFPFTNTGTVDAQIGSISIAGPITSSGVFNAASGASLVLQRQQHVQRRHCVSAARV